LDPRQDSLFIKFPVSGKLKLKNGYVANMPFHIYDADGTGISGYVDYEKLKKLLREQEGWNDDSLFEVAPVISHINNRTSALVTFFIVKYYDTVVGPYDEVAFTFMARRRDSQIPLHVCKSFACPVSLMSNPHYYTKLLKLFVSQQDTYHYGREYLGIDKSVIDTSIVRQKNGISKIVARFTDPLRSGHTYFDATIDLKRDTIADILLLPRLLMEGNISYLFSSMFDILFKRPQLLNMIGARGVHNNPIFKTTDPVLVTLLKSELLVNEWDTQTNSLTISDDYYGNLDFQPIVVTDQRGYKSIFFEPYNGGNIEI
jgi:hypothetical protein